MSKKTWFVTGCSTGFGRAICELALAKGDNVVVTARKLSTITDLHEKYGDNALCLELDVTNNKQISEALSKAIASFGNIDILVNNAGYGLQASIEDASDEQIRNMFETNVFGLMNVTRTFLPILRAQETGHIINISSIGGRLSAPMVGLYSASKFAVEGFSIGLAAETAQFGIKVTCIAPGGFNTNFSTTSIVAPKASAPYKAMADGMQEYVKNAKFDNPKDAAIAIYEIAGIKEPPLQLVLGKHATNMAQMNLNKQLEELNQWRELSQSVTKE